MTKEKVPDLPLDADSLFANFDWTYRSALVHPMAAFRETTTSVGGEIRYTSLVLAALVRDVPDFPARPEKGTDRSQGVVRAVLKVSIIYSVDSLLMPYSDDHRHST